MARTDFLQAGQAPRNTAEHLLDVAQEQFAIHGYHATSLRDVTAKARVHQGAVTYHFGSKEELLARILTRGAAGLNERRTARLLQLVTGEEALIELKAVLEAFIEPSYELLDSPNGRYFLRVQGDISAERTDVSRSLIAEQYDACVELFISLLALCKPRRSRQSLLWYYQFLLGALLNSLTQSDYVVRHREGRDRRAEKEQLIAFLAAALSDSIHQRHQGSP